MLHRWLRVDTNRIFELCDLLSTLEDEFVWTIRILYCVYCINVNEIFKSREV